MLVARAVRGLLKVRYLVLGGAVGGGMTLNKVCYIINMYLKKQTSLFVQSDIKNLNRELRMHQSFSQPQV